MKVNLFSSPFLNLHVLFWYLRQPFSIYSGHHCTGKVQVTCRNKGMPLFNFEMHLILIIDYIKGNKKANSIIYYSVWGSKINFACNLYIISVLSSISSCLPLNGCHNLAKWFDSACIVSACGGDVCFTHGCCRRRMELHCMKQLRPASWT